MKKTFLSAAVPALMLLFIIGCKKGDAGPQGPMGNANVMYSDWFKPATYKKDTLFGIWGFNHTETAPAITQAILDSGTILTFGKMHGYNRSVWPEGQVGQLPITITYMQGGLQNDTWRALARPGTLRIRFENDHNIYTSISNTHEFRYIILPAGTPVGGRAAQLSYEEICRKYNIPE